MFPGRLGRSTRRDTGGGCRPKLRPSPIRPGSALLTVVRLVRSRPPVMTGPAVRLTCASSAPAASTGRRRVTTRAHRRKERSPDRIPRSPHGPGRRSDLSGFISECSAGTRHQVAASRSHSSRRQPLTPTGWRTHLLLKEGGERRGRHQEASAAVSYWPRHRGTDQGTSVPARGVHRHRGRHGGNNLQTRCRELRYASCREA